MKEIISHLEYNLLSYILIAIGFVVVVIVKFVGVTLVSQNDIGFSCTIL